MIYASPIFLINGSTQIFFSDNGLIVPDWYQIQVKTVIMESNATYSQNF